MRPLLFASALLLAAQTALAQSPPTAPLPPGHPQVEPGGEPAHAAGIQRATTPEEGAFEAPDLPAGVVLVRVVDAHGNPVPDAMVHLGSLREGERGPAADLRSRPDGVAQFEHVATGASIAYRASVDADGAHFTSTPFQLTGPTGERVQIVRFDVTHDTRPLLISEGRIEISFQDDRLIIVERHAVVNFSGLSSGGEAPHPVAYATPPEGLRFSLPADYSAFRADEQNMGDQHVVEEHGAAVFHGSLVPTADPRDPVRIVFQFREHLRGDRLEFDLAIPIPVLRALVLSQAPAGMRLEVTGMPEPESRMHDGQRIFVTGRELNETNRAPLDHLHITLSGLPPVAGPERILALIATLVIAFGSAGLGFTRSYQANRAARAAGETDALKVDRARLLAEAQELGRARARAEIGPETHERRRRELAIALARVMRSLGE